MPSQTSQQQSDLSIVSGRSHALQAGQVYEARVSRIHDGQLELMIGDSCLLADSPYRFRQGDRLSLRCMGRRDGQLRFELAMPEGKQSSDSLAALVRAAGIPANAESLKAVGGLLSLGLPVNRANIGLVSELDALNCQLDAGLAQMIRHLRAKSVDIDPAGLAAYGSLQQSGSSLAAFIRRCFPDLTEELLAGGGSEPASTAGVRHVLQKLYGTWAAVEKHAQLEASGSSSLFGLLRMLSIYAERDRAKLLFLLPCSSGIADYDIHVEYSPLGRRSYRQCFSALLTLPAVADAAMRIHAVDNGAGLQLSMLQGDAVILEQLRRTDVPGMQAAAVQSRMPDGSFISRLPISLLQLLARLVAVRQERD